MWTPPFACPQCRASLEEAQGVWHCRACDRHFGRSQGLYRFLSPADQAALAPFHAQYRRVRERDGYRERSPEYYRKLPLVSPDHPRAAEWRIRRETYAQFQVRALPPTWSGSLRVLDLGAGNGWLTHRLSASGCDAVAVDRLDDEEDGLGACRHYPLSFPAVQADFDRLPFCDASVDLVVLNGSLHYAADPARTLAEARRVLAPGGAVAVMDSPMFVHAEAGARMVDEQRRRFRDEYGVGDVVSDGVGFLTFAALADACRALGLHGRFFPTRGPLMWRLRRQLARARIRRAPAAFGLWVAR